MGDVGVIRVKDMTPRERTAWVAGFLTGRGSFSYGTVHSPGRTPKRYISLVIRHVGEKDTLERFMLMAKLKHKISPHKIGNNVGWSVRISGGPLADFMTRIWEWLPEERRQDYLFVDAMVVEYNKQFEKGKR